MNKPFIKPSNPNFSSGPCAKRPNWNINHLKDSTVGRSHRSKIGKEKLKFIINKSKEILNLPKNYADNVLCLETIEYISDPIQFLKNIHELLKKNGYLIISCPFMFPIHHDYESDFYRLSISFYKTHLNELFHFEKIVTTGGAFEIFFDSIRIKFSYKINFINKFFLLIWNILRPIFTFLDFCIFKDNHYVNSGYILVLKKI